MTSKQRAHLRTLAHPLKPLLQVGKEGVTEAAVAAVLEALTTREVLKVRVLEMAPGTPRAAGEALVAAIEGAELVQTIGRTLVVYRPHPDHPAPGPEGPRRTGRRAKPAPKPAPTPPPAAAPAPERPRSAEPPSRKNAPAPKRRPAASAGPKTSGPKNGGPKTGGRTRSPSTRSAPRKRGRSK